MSEPKPLYGVSFDHQRELIGELCWGSCGHGLPGAIAVGPVHVIPCNREGCPHLDAEAGPVAAVDGRPLVIRRLRRGVQAPQGGD